MLSSVSVSQAFSGAGSGTENAPYVITDVNELQEMNNEFRKNIK